MAKDPPTGGTLTLSSWPQMGGFTTPIRVGGAGGEPASFGLSSRRSPAELLTADTASVDGLAALRRITQRRVKAEREWRAEILRLFAVGHSIQVIAAAAGVRYEVIVEIVRPRQ
jgi:hypothetical protein